MQRRRGRPLFQNLSDWKFIRCAWCTKQLLSLHFTPSLAFALPFPTWICFIHLFPSSLSFIFNFLLRHFLPFLPVPLVLLFFFFSPSTTLVDYFTITRVEIFYYQVCCNWFRGSWKIQHRRHTPPQLLKFVGKFSFRDREKLQDQVQNL